MMDNTNQSVNQSGSGGTLLLALYATSSFCIASHRIGEQQKCNINDNDLRFAVLAFQHRAILHTVVFLFVVGIQTLDT